MCENFGLHFEDAKSGASDRPLADTRYSVKVGEGRIQLVCRHCGQTFLARSNRAIRAVVRCFHSQSLPFATCPDSSCASFDANVFENYAVRGKPQSRRSYHKVSDTGVTCSRCGSSVTLGETLGLRGELKEKRRRIETQLTAVLTNVRMRRTLWWYDVHPQSYKTGLLRMGAVLGSYHSWLNAKLLNRDAGVDFSKTARVYTDVMETRLRRQGPFHRSRPLKIIISVLAVNRTAFVLAAHPYFMPVKFGPPLEADFYDPTTGLPDENFKEEWQCIEHPAHVTFEGTPEKTVSRFPDVSRWGEGHYIQDSFAELAHLLVVRKMLQRFERICFYTDAARGLIQAAMVGLADDIRSRRVEVVLFQRSKKKGKTSFRARMDMGAIGSDKRRAALRAAWEGTEKRVQHHFEETFIGDSETIKNATRPKSAAKSFRVATKGGFAKSSEFAWLRFPAPLGKEREVRSLWLTRMPDKTFADAEEDLVYSTLQPVDSVMNAARDRVLSLRRPRRRAEPGVGYGKNYVDPLSVLSEISIYFLCRNYAVMSKDSRRDKVIPARELGLIGDQAPFQLRERRLSPRVKHLFDIAEKFRLNLSHADTIRGWLRK